MNIQELKNIANGQLESIASYLLPSGKVERNNYIAGSVYGESGKSLSLCLSGPKQGVFKDFAETGHEGDIIDLWRLNRSISFIEAKAELMEFLGIREEQPAPHKKKAYKKPDKSGIKKIIEKDAVDSYLRDDRGINPDIIKKLNISKTNHSKFGESIVFPIYSPESQDVTMIKYLALKRQDCGKKNTWISADSEQHLFGWQTISDNDRDVIIFEGEIDCATSIQWGFPSLSLPMGVNGMNWIESDYPYLDRFEKIYLCFDNDEAGQKAFKEVSERLGPERCHKVLIPHKDLNDGLLNGFDADEFKQCLDKSKTIDPPEISRVEDFLEDVDDYLLSDTRKEDRMGTATPFHKDFRIRESELSIITGIAGHGKSLALSQMIVNDIDQGERCCIASMEIPIRNQIALAVTQCLGRDARTKADIKKSFEFLNPNMIFVNYEGEIDYKKIIKQFIYARKRYNCTRFIIDSLLYCVNTEDLSEQKSVVRDFRQFALKYKAHVFMVAHSRKGSDEDQIPGKMDVAGSADIFNIADNGITVWRNKQREDGQEGKYPCDAVFKVWKQRETGREPFAQLFYKPRSNTFGISEMEFSKKYVITEG